MSDAPTIHFMTMAAKKAASLQTEEQIIQGDEHVSKIIPSFKRRFEASSSTVRRELFNESEDNPYETPKKMKRKAVIIEEDDGEEEGDGDSKGRLNIDEVEEEYSQRLY